MPYRLKFDESIRKGFRRIGREQIDLAIAELSKVDVAASAVHESRKAMKRSRAVVRCFSPSLGAKAARQFNQSLRAIAQQLSGRRDADVALETVAQLEAHCGAEAAITLRPLRDLLQARRVAAGVDTLDVQTRNAIQSELTALRLRFGKANLKGRGIDPVMQGIEDSYSRGRKALKAAYAAPSDLAFHELRKSVQTHWRQMALLSRAWPDEFAARVLAARELSQLLGDDHDIAVLKTMVAELDVSLWPAMLTICETRQAELRADSYFRAQRLYAERPRAFGRRMTELWAAGRRVKPIAAAVANPSPSVTHLADAATPSEIGSQHNIAAKTLAPSPSQRRA
jgi:CHAD domain-containing protein